MKKVLAQRQKAEAKVPKGRAKKKAPKQSAVKRTSPWGKGLDRLSQQRFRSRQEAVAAVFDLLATRLGRVSDEERTHLTFLVESDPVLQRVIDNLVQSAPPRRSK